VDAGKRHHRALDAGDLPPWIRDTYEALQAGAAGNEEKMHALLRPVLDGFDSADALYGSLVRDLAADCAGTREKYRLSREKFAAKSAELKVLKARLRQSERSAGGKLNRLLGRLKAKKEA
jgi:hypothetical protein